jgi:hypothetical protein
MLIQSGGTLPRLRLVGSLPRNGLVLSSKTKPYVLPINLPQCPTPLTCIIVASGTVINIQVVWPTMTVAHTGGRSCHVIFAGLLGVTWTAESGARGTLGIGMVARDREYAEHLHIRGFEQHIVLVFVSGMPRCLRNIAGSTSTCPVQPYPGRIALVAERRS